ncbi:hypothetical protein Golax_021652 [Gossypium laxum]|uniref:Uncharacterized protein n=2 Tax=Gossypium TaxID=3633 RepID=A0A7J8QED1_GOSRA|nr:hypothetical protein [Gossypium raimondii]MBA0725023.1 hypothetical protein [Gossypium laxum]
MGENYCCNIVAIACVSKEACLSKNSLCYWNIKGWHKWGWKFAYASGQVF